MPTSLNARSPVTGDTLLLNGQSFEITDRSTYRNSEGYFVTEFCAEDDDSENYLLRESYPDGSVKWFFTKWQEPSGFADGSDRKIEDYLKNGDLKLPPRITYKNEQFTLEDRTDGTYADNPGEDEKKITFDYWTDDHKRNLAIESWENGSYDFYIGSYIDPNSATLDKGGSSGLTRRSRSSDDASNNPFTVIGTSLLFLVFVVPELSFIPVDALLSGILGIITLSLFVRTATQVPFVTFAATTVVGLTLTFLFDRFAPLGTWQGAGLVLLAPFILCKLCGDNGPKGPQARLCALMMLAAVLAAGFRRYFSFAPEPHSLPQYLLALAPAFICGAIAHLLALFMLQNRTAEQNP